MDDEDVAMFPIMPFSLYQSMSDQDMGDLIAYLQSLEPKGDEPPEAEFADPNMTPRCSGIREKSTSKPSARLLIPPIWSRAARISANQAICMHCHGQL